MAEVEEAPAKGGLIKIILMVVVVLLIAVGSALGALFFTGFEEKESGRGCEEAIAELEAEIEGTDAVQMPEKSRRKRLKRSSSLRTTLSTNLSWPMSRVRARLCRSRLLP